jgi:pectate lyase
LIPSHKTPTKQVKLKTRNGTKIMKSKTSGKIAFIGIIAMSLVAPPNIFAFGYGFGAGATGGTNPYKVTNLNDSGAGSFRTGVGTSGNDVTFAVSGTIVLHSELAVASNVTIDGTTANITITNNTVSLSGSHNIIIKNIRFREGEAGGSGKCSLQGDPYSNVMIDHCSIELGRWDCFEATGGSSGITVQYCIIDQGIDPQYFGGLLDADNDITLHHNLWIDNNDRNPKLEANSQYINNVVYNWIDAGGLEGSHSAAPWKSDVIGNYFIKGPLSANDNWAFDCTANDEWYHLDNYMDLNANGVLDGVRIQDSDYTTLGITQLATQQYNPTPAVPVDDASTAVSEAASGAWGCQPLDAFDATLVGYLKSYGTAGRKGP